MEAYHILKVMAQEKVADRLWSHLRECPDESSWYRLWDRLGYFIVGRLTDNLVYRLEDVR